MTKITLIFVFLLFTFAGCETPPANTTVNTNSSNQSTHTENIESKNQSQTASMLYKLPTAYSSFPQKKGGACAFDQPSSEGGNKFISGWSAISTGDGTLPEAVILVIKAKGEERFFVALSKQKREDVAKYFKSPKLIDSGFSASIKQEDIPNEAEVSLLQVFQGVLYSCDANLKL